MPRYSLILALSALLLGCPSDGPADDDDTSDDDDATGADDDDATAGDDDDASSGDDDDSTPCSVTLAGNVLAIDRESGAILSDEEYEDRAGGLILYVLPEADDLSIIHDKVTMTGPGTWSMTLSSCLESVDVAAVVDIDKDFIISSYDILREHPFNPVFLPANGLVEDLDIVIDLPRIEDDTLGDDDDDDDSGPGGPGKGDDDDASGPGDDDDDLSGPGDDDDDDASGPGDDDDDDDDDDDATAAQCPSNFTGDVIVTDYPDNAIVVTANAEDLSDGPWAAAYLAAPAEFEMEVACLDTLTSFIGILDNDANGFFEPSDPAGVSDNNPWNLGFANTAGVHIEIPSIEGVPVPAPAPYDGISGTVIYDDFLTGDVLVFATAVHPDGQIFSQATLAAPGPFSLIAPPDAEDILVWAVLDENGDGQYDVYIDPYDDYGPFDMDGAETGITLDLSPDPPEPGSIAGFVYWPDDDAEAGDCLRTGIFDVEPSTAAAVPFTPLQVVSGPSFPVPFFWDELPPGQWWVAAYLDRECSNDALGAGPEDPDGQVTFPVQLPPAGVIEGVEVWLTD